MALRTRRLDGGPFMSCSGFPNCRFAESYYEALDEAMADWHQRESRRERREPRRERTTVPPDFLAVDRGLRRLIAIVHPDKNPREGTLAHLLTVEVNRMREELKKGR